LKLDTERKDRAEAQFSFAEALAEKPSSPTTAVLPAVIFGPPDHTAESTSAPMRIGTAEEPEMVATPPASATLVPPAEVSKPKTI